jgi:hypothetical protein
MEIFAGPGVVPSAARVACFRGAQTDEALRPLDRMIDKIRTRQLISSFHNRLFFSQYPPAAGSREKFPLS